LFLDGWKGATRESQPARVVGADLARAGSAGAAVRSMSNRTHFAIRIPAKLTIDSQWPKAETLADSLSPPGLQSWDPLGHRAWTASRRFAGEKPTEKPKPRESQRAAVLGGLGKAWQLEATSIRFCWRARYRIVLRPPSQASQGCPGALPGPSPTGCPRCQGAAKSGHFYHYRPEPPLPFCASPRSA
jgi:hypothetical protein